LLFRHAIGADCSRIIAPVAGDDADVWTRRALIGGVGAGLAASGTANAASGVGPVWFDSIITARSVAIGRRAGDNEEQQSADDTDRNQEYPLRTIGDRPRLALSRLARALRGTLFDAACHGN
jgi:hypothetical protein